MEHLRWLPKPTEYTIAVRSRHGLEYSFGVVAQSREVARNVAERALRAGDRIVGITD